MALEPKKKEEEVEQEPAKLSAQELQALMPTASPLEEEVTPQSNPGFGLPEIREDISEVGTKSHSIDFLTEGLGSPMAGSAGLDPSLENDQLGQVNQNTEMASQILLDPNLSSDVRLQKAKDKIRKSVV